MSLQTGLPLIKNFEGCKLEAYLDIVGVPTIGYGETEDVCMGMFITQDEADAMLSKKYDKLESDILGLGVSLNENQLGALVSFAYNLGLGALKSSTLLKKLRNKDPSAVDEFVRWNKAGGKVVAGLTRRRLAEVALFNKKF